MIIKYIDNQCISRISVVSDFICSSHLQEPVKSDSTGISEHNCLLV